MTKKFLIALSALSVVSVYAKHAELESVARMKADIEQKEQQIQKLVNEVSSLRMQHAEARSRALNSISAREGKQYDDDGYGDLKDGRAEASEGAATYDRNYSARSVRWNHGA